MWSEPNSFGFTLGLFITDNCKFSHNLVSMRLINVQVFIIKTLSQSKNPIKKTHLLD